MQILGYFAPCQLHLFIYIDLMIYIIYIYHVTAADHLSGAIRQSEYLFGNWWAEENLVQICPCGCHGDGGRWAHGDHSPPTRGRSERRYGTEWCMSPQWPLQGHGWRRYAQSSQGVPLAAMWSPGSLQRWWTCRPSDANVWPTERQPRQFYRSQYSVLHGGVVGIDHSVYIAQCMNYVVICTPQAGRPPCSCGIDLSSKCACDIKVLL